MTGDALRTHATQLFNRFPLSSHKLLYESDKEKVTPDAWQVLEEVAVATDKAKLADCNKLWAEAGCELEKEFGRAKL